MNSDRFISYLKKPELLNEDSIKELTGLVEDFPYFQSARLLLTINLFKEKDIHYHSVLKKTAIYAGSRNVLKKHIDAIENLPGKAESVKDPELEKTEKTTEDISVKKDGQIKDSSTDNQNVSSNTIEELKKIIEQRIREIEEKNKTKEKPAKPVNKKKKFQLIDEFIAKQPTISRPKAKFYDPLETAKESVVEKEDIVSETLAKIYMDQGYFEKAIKMYEKLILKFPEKSSYFAALIEKANNELNKKQ